MRALLAATCLLPLAACASEAPEWRKPMTDAAQIRMDLADCAEIAQKQAFVGGQPPDQELLLQQSLRNECMRGRGYDLTGARSFSR